MLWCVFTTIKKNTAIIGIIIIIIIIIIIKVKGTR
jgi:hypothetical protein